MITTNNIPNHQLASSCLDERPLERCHVLVPDIFNIICSYLEIKDLGILSLVSREWHVLSGHDEIWKRYQNEFKVQSPEIKAKIGFFLRSLDIVYDEIEKTFNRGTNAYFFCRFIRILFEGNVKIVKVSLEQPRVFTIILRKTRQIYFNDPDFKNITIPKVVSFTFSKQLIFLNDDNFDLPPIDINTMPINLSLFTCAAISIISSKRLLVSYHIDNYLPARTQPDSLVAFLDPALVKDS